METPSLKSQKQRGTRWKEDHFLKRLKDRHEIDATHLLQWLEKNSKSWAEAPDASPLSRAMDHVADHKCKRVTAGDRECAAYRAVRILGIRVDSDHQNPERLEILPKALKRRRALTHMHDEFAQMFENLPVAEQLRHWRNRATVAMVYTKEFSDALFKATVGLEHTLRAIEHLVALAPDLEEEFGPGAKPRLLLAHAEKTLRIGGFEDARIVEMLKDGGKPSGAKKRMNGRLEGMRDSEEIAPQPTESTDV